MTLDTFEVMQVHELIKESNYLILNKIVQLEKRLSALEEEDRDNSEPRTAHNCFFFKYKVGKSYCQLNDYAIEKREEVCSSCGCHKFTSEVQKMMKIERKR